MAEEKKATSASAIFIAISKLERALRQEALQKLHHILEEYNIKKMPQQANQSRSSTSTSVAHPTENDEDIAEQHAQGLALLENRHYDEAISFLRNVYDHWNSKYNQESSQGPGGLGGFIKLRGDKLRDAASSLGKALFEQAKPVERLVDRLVGVEEARLYLQEAFDLQDAIIRITGLPGAVEDLQNFKSLVDQCDEEIGKEDKSKQGLTDYNKGMCLVKLTLQLTAEERKKALQYFMKAFNFFEERGKTGNNLNNMNLACLQASAFMVGSILLRNPAKENPVPDLEKAKIWFERVAEIERLNVATVKDTFEALVGAKKNFANLDSKGVKHFIDACDNAITQFKTGGPTSFAPGFFGAASSSSTESSVAPSTQSSPAEASSPGTAPVVTQSILTAGQPVTP